MTRVKSEKERERDQRKKRQSTATRPSQLTGSGHFGGLEGCKRRKRAKMSKVRIGMSGWMKKGLARSKSMTNREKGEEEQDEDEDGAQKKDEDNNSNEEKV